MEAVGLAVGRPGGNVDARDYRVGDPVGTDDLLALPCSAVDVELPELDQIPARKKQSAAATRFIEKSLTTDVPGYINHITLCEIVWVLQRCYDVAKQQLRDIIEGLLTTKQLIVENVEVAWKALTGIVESFAAAWDEAPPEPDLGEARKYLAGLTDADLPPLALVRIQESLANRLEAEGAVDEARELRSLCDTLLEDHPELKRMKR